MAKAKKTEDDLFAEIREEVKSEPKPTKKAAPKPKAEPKEEDVVEEAKEEVKAEPKKQATAKTFQKPASKFSDKDMIPCKSVTSGGLSYMGNSGTNYRWEDQGVIEYVAYEDLKREAQSANPNNYLYYPRFIVVDADFVEEFPKLEEFYSKFYQEGGDFEAILNLPDNQMTEEIAKLPKGCKECIKGIIATQIDEGTLDSVKKIKTLDEIFGTNNLLKLASN